MEVKCNKMLRIDAKDQVQLGYCDEPPTVLQMNRPEFGEMVQRLASFHFENDRERLAFQGEGEIAGVAWQHAVLNWTHLSYGEAASGQFCAACRTALSWFLGQEADDPTRCIHLTVMNYGYGYADIVPCSGGVVQASKGGWLEDSEWQMLDLWLMHRQPLYLERNYLAGEGTGVMSEAEQAQLVELVQATHARLSQQ